MIQNSIGHLAMGFFYGLLLKQSRFSRSVDYSCFPDEVKDLLWRWLNNADFKTGWLLYSSSPSLAAVASQAQQSKSLQSVAVSCYT